MSKRIARITFGLVAVLLLGGSGGTAAHASTSVAEKAKGYNFHNQTKHEALESYLRKVVKPKHTASYNALTDALANRLPACEYEDSRNCVWFAQDRGNGIGTSFVNIYGTTWFFTPRESPSPR